MIKLLSEEVEAIINHAWTDASTRKQEYLLFENILLSLIKHPTGKSIMVEFNIDWGQLAHELNDFLDNEIEKSENTKIPKQTSMFKKMIQFLIFHTQSSGKISKIEDLLIAMFNESESPAACLMAKYGLDAYALKEYAIQHSSSETPQLLHRPKLKGEGGTERSGRDDGRSEKTKTSLDEYSTNLTQHAKDGKLDPVIGRDDEVTRMIQILCRKKKNNPLLIGESGVGKTALIEKLAQDIVDGNTPEHLRGWEVFSIDMTSMIAGARYRGDFEKRMQNLIKELEEKEKCIAFIDEFHTVFGLGANSNQQLDATNMLKPAMSSGKIRLIGATTYDEAKNTVDKNKPMSRRFQKVDVCEPDEETTIKIISGLKNVYEEYHNVFYSDNILQKIVSLTGKYINDSHFPDKAIDVLDEVGSIIKLKSTSKVKIHVKEKDIIDLITAKSRVPVEIEDGDDKKRLANLTTNILTRLYGQDHAVEEVSDKIMMGRAGLNDYNKPLCAFMLAGQSGVGKTELVRLLSKELGGLHLVRYDCSELNDDVSINKLIGSSQGYVGYEEGGRLINDILKTPHCILLLDEFEKAHPKIQNTFLQILEEAELTAADGTVADFRNVMIFFTTNAGTKVSKTVGFGGDAGKSKSNSQIEKIFTPEFRNRLDGVIHFNALTPEQILLVTEKILNEMRDQLKLKNVTLTVTKAAKELLALRGFDREMGARPMKRVIQDLIKKPIAREIVIGSLSDGGRVRIDANKSGEITLKYAQVNVKSSGKNQLSNSPEFEKILEIDD